MKKSLNSPLSMFLLFALSAGMLTVIQAPFKFGFLAWAALVPFILACNEDVQLGKLVIVSYLVAVVYWLGNLYFVAYVAVGGYAVFCLFLGMYWPVVSVCVWWLRKKKFPLFAALPFLIAGAEAWQGVIFTGFSWRLLGHSQWQWLELIQIADIFGAIGVTFIIAMANAVIAQIVIDYKKHRLKAIALSVNSIGIVVVGVVIVGSVVYGRYRIDETSEHITKGPMIGSVQPNIPTAVQELSEDGEAILDELIADSRECFDAGAKMVVWPETMVLATMNKEYLDACRIGTSPVVYAQAISELAKDRGYVMFGAHAADIFHEGGYWKIGDKYNSAMLYKPNGRQADERFDKIHLVPFGEFIPLRNANPLILKLFLFLSHYDYDYSLKHGSEYTTFSVPIEGKDYHCGAIICYEDTDARVTRRMVMSDSGVKKVDWLVNMSNDGWYVRYDKDTKKVMPSTELSQRTVITVFRCIENRISIIRSVNTGVSCLIDSTGAICDGYVAGNLPEKVMDRQGVGGWFVDAVNVDDRRTFFSVNGLVGDKICQVMFAVVPIITLCGIISDRKRIKLTSK